MIHNRLLFPVEIAGLDNFIKARRIQVSFVSENFKPNSQAHISFPGSESGLTDTSK